MKNCQYAYHKAGDVSVHCKKLEGMQSDYCLHQYMCNNSKRWEVTPHGGRTCPVKQK